MPKMGRNDPKMGEWMEENGGKWEKGLKEKKENEEKGGK